MPTARDGSPTTRRSPAHMRASAWTAAASARSRTSARPTERSSTGLRDHRPANVVGRRHGRGGRYHSCRSRASDSRQRAVAQGGAAPADGQSTAESGGSDADREPGDPARVVWTFGHTSGGLRSLRPRPVRRPRRKPRPRPGPAGPASPSGSTSTSRPAPPRSPSMTARTRCCSSSTATPGAPPRRPDLSAQPSAGLQQAVTATVEHERRAVLAHRDLDHLADEDQVISGFMGGVHAAVQERRRALEYR